MLDGCDPVAFVERMHARCEKRYTPCGDGRMVWRIWGEGEPVVLLHGGSDHNVPRGERDQMYAALKILGKEVEYIRVADHYFEKRDAEAVGSFRRAFVDSSIPENLDSPALYYAVRSAALASA